MMASRYSAKDFALPVTRIHFHCFLRPLPLVMCERTTQQMRLFSTPGNFAIENLRIGQSPVVSSNKLRTLEDQFNRRQS
jgi:hypothetical protein